MKISVIIPAHNEAAGISASLEAILKQDYTDFEVIVVDNASDDGTALVCARYPVKVVREDRKGTMWACEHGRQEARGEIIVRMDADCLPKKDWLSRGAVYFTDKKITAVSGPYYYHDAPIFFRRSSLIIQRYVYPIANFILQKLQKGAVTIGGNTFIRADILDKMGGFNTDLAFYGDDTDTAKRAARFGYVVFSKDLIMPTTEPAGRFGGAGRTKKIFKYWFHFFKVVFSD